MSVQIRLATISDVDSLVPLFDAYRQFYCQPSDTTLAHTFLSERFKQRQSVIFLAIDTADQAVGFAQLFPSFSSARASCIYILNDLFVMPSARRQGVASQLLREVAEFGHSMGAVRLSLATALDNNAAQKLYESMDWKRDDIFCYYNLSL